MKTKDSDFILAGLTVAKDALDRAKADADISQWGNVEESIEDAEQYIRAIKRTLALGH